MFTQQVSLNGNWSFTPYSNSSATESESIHIPSMWTHGECWKFPLEWIDVEQAWIERNISIPIEWNDLDCILYCEAVAFKAEIFINDQKVGEHIGGFMPFEVPLPLQAGDSARLRILVTGSSAIEDGYALLHPVSYPVDFEEGPVPRGIWQDIHLLGRPATRIIDASYSYHDQQFHLTVDSNAATWSISGDLVAPARETNNISIDVKHLTQWSPDNPVLYHLDICAHDEAGNICHRYPLRFGLRTVCCVGEEIQLNDTPIRLFGFSMVRHRISPHLWRHDYLTTFLTTLQKIGFNCVRVHACIGPSVIYDVCDELGMLVEAQSSMWSSAEKNYLKGGERFQAHAIQELQEWVIRDRHHPSIILWDVENELYRINQAWDKPVQKFIETVRNIDSTRPVLASGAAAWPHGDIMHIHCEPSLSAVIGQQRKWADTQQAKRPLIAGEWWGDTVYWGTRGFIGEGLFGASRHPVDFSSQQDIDQQIAFWYGEEIRKHRMMNICGTFPFSVEVYLFDQLFGSQEINIPADHENTLRIDYAENHENSHMCEVRRPYVNPQWDTSLPTYRLNSKVGPALIAAFTPVLIDIAERGCSLYAQTTNRKTLVICNDSGKTIHRKLNIFAQGHLLQTIDIQLEHYQQQRLELSLHPQKIGHFELTAQWENESSVLSIKSWQVYSPTQKRMQTLAYSGTDTQIQTALNKRGITYTITDEAPEKQIPWIISSLENVNSEIENFIRTGGRVVLLRQERQPTFFHAGVLQRNSTQVNHPVSVPYGLAQVSRERSALPSSTHLSNFFSEKTIGPWQSGRIADDSWTWPQAEAGRNLQGLLSGRKLDEYILATISSGQGAVLCSQLCLTENLGLEAQADMVFDRILDWCFEQQTEIPVAYSTSNKDFDLALTHSHGPFQVSEEVNLRFIESQEELQSDHTQAFLHAGGEVFCVLTEEHPQWPRHTLANYTISLLNRPPLLHGINSLHLENIPGCNTGFSSIPEEWSSSVAIFPWKNCSHKAGMYVEDSTTCLIAHKAVGKGHCYMSCLPLIHTDLSADFWRTIIVNAGIRSERPLAIQDETRTTIQSHKSPSLPLDGDYWKWRNAEIDKVISPWACTTPAVLNIDGDTSQHGAIAYALYDTEHLYTALIIVSPEHSFSGTPNVWNDTSFDFFVGPSQIVASQDPNGQPTYFMNGIQIDEAHLRLNITQHDELPEWPDLSMLPLDTNFPLKACFFELAIPWSALGHTTPPREPFPIAFGSLHSISSTEPQVAHGKFPAGFRNMQLPTYAMCVLE